MAGMFSPKTFALIGETCLAIWAAYVFYRWHYNLTPDGMIYWAFDPFMGPFETVVAPLLFSSFRSRPARSACISCATAHTHGLRAAFDARPHLTRHSYILR